MLRNMITYLSISLVFTLLIQSFGQDNTQSFKDKFLGQSLPGLIPEKFAPGLVSTESSELNCVFTPDGKECFFTVWKQGVNTIMTIKKRNGGWTQRSVASFSGVYSDVDPFITSDGKRLYFSSMRPLGGGSEAKDSDLWYVEKDSEGNWNLLTHLHTLNAPGKDDYYTSISQNETIYFSIFESHRSPGDIYRSRFIDGVYSTPEKLEYDISSEYNEHDPFISPDENYLIFTSNRPGGFGRGDLYISFRQSDGSWAEPQNMGKEINTEAYEYCPMVSHDGQFLFFTRNINQNGDIYWVSSKIIDSLQNNAKK